MTLRCTTFFLATFFLAGITFPPWVMVIYSISVPSAQLDVLSETETEPVTETDFPTCRGTCLTEGNQIGLGHGLGLGLVKNIGARVYLTNNTN
jgi:hypothetical protein